jgi:hypothetical protein
MNPKRIDAFFEEMNNANLEEARQIRDAFYAHQDAFSEEDRVYLKQRLRERTEKLLSEVSELEREAEAYFEIRRRATV